MPYAAAQIALIEVIRAHAHLHEPQKQPFHRLRIVIDPAQEHGLISKRDARIHERGAGARRLRREFVRVVEVCVDPDWVILAEHVGQLLRDAHWHHDRHARADTDDLHMLDCAKRSDDVLQLCRAHGQRVPTGDEHVPNLRMRADIGDRLLQLRLGNRLVLLADGSSACAVTAIHCALQRDEQQHPVGIAMHHVRHRAIRHFAQRVG
ncbi:hypothetical protein SDC9_147557 [bioreactor metagenome]|uniref:Uncharacterized protein n=1 Tax=bioreactor metagenome TaxID=1076179 RepID=A0A645EIF1_9ZZZZ